jgi:hypothetical protein
MSSYDSFKQKIRSILTVIILGSIFIAGTTYALIISRGNSLTAEGISATGTIRLSISPNSNYTVYLNEQAQRITTNNTVENLTPGEYTLKIQKDGYSTWQRTIQIKAGLITDVSAQLFPSVLQLEQLSKTNISQATYSPSRRVVVYTATNIALGGTIGIWQQNLQRSNIPLIDESPIKITNLTSRIVEAANNNTLKVKISPNDDRLIVQTADSIYLLDMGRYNEPSEDNKLKFSFPVDSIEWLAKSSNNLLIRSGNLLIDYDINARRANIIVYQVDKAPIYTANNLGVIYSLGDTLYKYNSGVSNLIKLENISAPSGITHLYSGADNDSNLVIATADNLYYLNTTNSYLGALGKYEFISMSPTGQNVLVKDGDTLKSLRIDISLIRNSVDITQTKSGIVSLVPESIVWESTGSYFVYQTSTEPTKVFSADRTGNNLITIISSTQVKGSNYTIPQDNSGLIVTLLDSNASENRVNLYKVKF